MSPNGENNKINSILDLKNIVEKLDAKIKKLEDERNLYNKALQEVFPYSMYKYAYQDLLSLTDKEALDHYLNHGRNEERDIEEYKIKNLYSSYFRGQISDLVTYFCREGISTLTTDKSSTSNQLSNENNSNSRVKFLKTVGTKQKISNNSDHQFALRFSMYCSNANIMTTFIPKNACTSLRYSFAQNNGYITAPSDINWIHSNNDSMMPTISEIQNSAYSFIILRNPFDRILSFFLDKFINSSSDKNDKSYGDTFQKFDKNCSGKCFTFKEFINNLWMEPHLIFTDIHTKPQSSFLLIENYTEYYKLEEFNILSNKLRSEFSFELTDTRDFTLHTLVDIERKSSGYTGNISLEELSIMKNNKKHLPMQNNFFDEEDSFKVSALYLQDIILYCSKTNSYEEISEYLEKSLRYSTQINK